METSTHASSAYPPPVPPAPLAGRYRCAAGIRVDDHTLLFEARDLVADTPVLVLLDETVTEHSDEPATRWGRLRGIDHPVLPRTRDHGVEAGRAWVVCDVPAGEPLKDIVGGRFGERVSRREALDVIDTLLSLLEEFHDQGLVHGAVGPDTVFLADDGSVRLLPLVTAPAQAVTDPCEDVRAVGELLRVMIAGPGAGEDDGALFEAGDEFALLVDKATAADPDHRPRDAGRYRALVRRVRERLPAAPGRHAASGASSAPSTGDPTDPSEGSSGSAHEPPAQKTRRRRTLFLASACVVLFLLVAALLTWTLTVSEGVTLPDLVESSEEEALAALGSLGLAAEVVVSEESESPEGEVVSQSPTAGAIVEPESTVVLTVSPGPEDEDVQTLDEQPRDDTSDRGNERHDRGDDGPDRDPRNGDHREPGEESPETDSPEPATCASEPWSEGRNYSEGSRVVHEGREYEAIWWTGHVSPPESSEWGPWQEIGTC